MNTINIILRATKQNPFNSHNHEHDHSEFAHFALDLDNLISAEKIMTQPRLIENLKQFIKDNHVKDVDIKSSVRLESQLNSHGEFCISLNSDWFKHYFIVKIVHWNWSCSQRSWIKNWVHIWSHLFDNHLISSWRTASSLNSLVKVFLLAIWHYLGHCPN